MAVMPAELYSLSREDAVTVYRAEQGIDSLLHQEYERRQERSRHAPLEPIQIAILPEWEKASVFWELCRRYREAGWKVDVAEGNQDYSFTPHLSFAPLTPPWEPVKILCPDVVKKG